MRLDRFLKSIQSDMAFASAWIAWEDCDRPQEQVWLGVPERFYHDLNCDPNMFLLGVIIPAMQHGESRIQVEGKVCPRLRDGLITAIQILASWYGTDGHRPVEIEPTEGFEAPRPRLPRRTASLMSGGIDALATLWLNRRDYPLDHPASIRECLFWALDLPSTPIDSLAMELARESRFLLELVEQTQVELIPLVTNLGRLSKSSSHFALEGGGATLVAFAQAFRGRISTLLISSSDSIEDLVPHGTHPLLDPYYSSSALTVSHVGCHLSRLEKTRVVANWEVGLRALQTCNVDPERYPAHLINCGKCEKCLRTMLHLLYLGKLDQAPTFPADEVTPDMILNMEDVFQTTFLGHLVEPMKRLGRADLSDALIEVIGRYPVARCPV